MSICRSSTAGILAVALTACGGGGGNDTAATAAPAPAPSRAAPTAVHAAPTTSLTADNTPYFAASAQAVQSSLMQWTYALLLAANRVSPTAPRAVDQSPCLTIDYLDVDRNGLESASDQIRISSTDCTVSPLGGGTTTLTTLATANGDAVNARVSADNTLNALLLFYGWSQRMQGVWRVTLLADGTSIGLANESEISLTLADSSVLRLLNVALVFKPPVNGPASLTGQFDMRFDSGPKAGQLIAVDLVGELRFVGANVGPYPGYLQLAGRQGSRAQVQDTFDQNFSIQTRLDATGTGAFAILSTLIADQFYANLRQPVTP